jgi:hypothetical protein
MSALQKRLDIFRREQFNTLAGKKESQKEKRAEKAAVQALFGFILFALCGGLFLQMLPSAPSGNEPDAAVSYAVLNSERLFGLPGAQAINDRQNFVVI